MVKPSITDFISTTRRPVHQATMLELNLLAFGWAAA